MTDCYLFLNTEMTTSPSYLYDGDGLIFTSNKIGIVYHLYRDIKKMKEEVPVKQILCDICGREIQNEEDGWSVKIIKNAPYDDYYSGFNDNMYIEDVCPFCANKIKDYIDNISKKS